MKLLTRLRGSWTRVYIGLSITLVSVGVVWMLCDAVLRGEFGRASSLLFVSGLVVLFTPITIGLTSEYLANKTRKEERQ